MSEQLQLFVPPPRVQRCRQMTADRLVALMWGPRSDEIRRWFRDHVKSCEDCWSALIRCGRLAREYSETCRIERSPMPSRFTIARLALLGAPDTIIEDA